MVLVKRRFTSRATATISTFWFHYIISNGNITTLFGGRISSSIATTVTALSTMPISTPPPQQQQQPIRILAFGDSLTAGTSPPSFETFPYAPHLEKSLKDRIDGTTTTSAATATTTRDVVVRHVGFPGWTSNQMVDDATGPRGLQTTIQRIQDPTLSLVILLAGTNDLGMIQQRDEKSEILQSIIQLHELCYSSAVPHTIAIGIPPSAYQSMVPDVAECVQEINQQLEEYCQQQQRQQRRPQSLSTTTTTTTTTTSTTTYMPFPFEYERGGENWASDGLHLSPRGYQVLGESLAPIVEQILFLVKETT